MLCHRDPLSLRSPCPRLRQDSLHASVPGDVRLIAFQICIMSFRHLLTIAFKQESTYGTRPEDDLNERDELSLG